MSSGTMIASERGERILDAAGELLLRYGYGRITMDDIARQAGTGKGTIYLHWMTKDELFAALLRREIVAMWQALLAWLQEDVRRVRYSQVMPALLRIGMRRPLARALFTEDRELLGKLAERGLSGAEAMGVAQGDFLSLMREVGLLHTDMDLAAQRYALRAVVTGFLRLEAEGAESELSLDERAEALGETIRAVFEPEEIQGEEAGRRVLEWFEGFLGQVE